MAKNYTINAILKRPRLTPAGNIVEVYEISFTTTRGVNDTIDVIAADFTAATVDQVVTARATELEKVLSL